MRRSRVLPLLRAAGAMVLPAILCACMSGRQSSAEAAGVIRADTVIYVRPPMAGIDSTTFVEMRNVRFRLSENIVLGIRRLSAVVQPAPGFSVIDFDEKRSFELRIRSAEVAMTAASLEHLLNDYVLAWPGAPFRDIRVTIGDSLIRQKGYLRRGKIDVPFTMDGRAEPLPDGRVRIRPVTMRIYGAPGMDLMSAFGLTLEGVADLRRAPGLIAVGNDFILDIQRILPPPVVRGRVIAVRIENGELVQTLGPPVEGVLDIDTIAISGELAAPNGMSWRAGTIHFGKLFMTRTSLDIVDADPSDPFDFFLERYRDQLVAGWSRTLPDDGLMAYMPDWDDLGTGRGTVRPTTR